MLPITLDLARLPIVLVGNGPQAARRLGLLDEAGAERLTVFAPSATEALARQAGERLRRRWPTREEIGAARVLLIADRVEPAAVNNMIRLARAAGTLINVEDEPARSDFHSPAVLRRGDLLIAISTGGLSPALARRLRRFLGTVFGPEWQPILAELGRLRRFWRKAGADPDEVSAWTEAWLDREVDLPDGAVRAAPFVWNERDRAARCYPAAETVRSLKLGEQPNLS
ncbi:MAG TPA: NAD(P)-dependent oxidoreductase [Stellaceae bacterium]|nr:NAD(P)-dependent oxidoreductase [Stellaceae bacterium]